MLRIIAAVLVGSFGLTAAQPAHCALAASVGAAGAHAAHQQHPPEDATGEDGAAHSNHHPDGPREASVATVAHADADHTDAAGQARHSGELDRDGDTGGRTAACAVLTICGGAALPAVAGQIGPLAAPFAVEPVSVEDALPVRHPSADPPPPRSLDPR